MTTRIMPLGASNTYGMFDDPSSPGGYRGPLQYMLRGQGAAVDFVGLDRDGDVADPHHNGHPGKTIEWHTEAVDESIIDPHLRDVSHRVDSDGAPAIDHLLERGRMTSDDVVLLLLGTNNVLAGDSAETMLTHMDALLDRIVTHETSPEVLVMKLQPLGGDFWEDGDPSRTNNDTIEIFNIGLDRLVEAEYSRRGVHLVDMRATAADLAPDGIHLTEAGYRKAAAAWRDVLTAEDLLEFRDALPVLPGTAAASSDASTRRWFGGDGVDRFKGASADERIDGGAGGDIMRGRGGDDRYFVDDRHDRIVESPRRGTDTVYATLRSYRTDPNVENVTLLTDEDARLTGDERDNVLRSGGGDDRINGGRGGDVLFGGAGDDVFVLHAGAADGDRVRDFRNGDTLQFAGFGAGAVLANLGQDRWSVSHLDGVEVVQVLGQSSLIEGDDYFFV